MAEAKTGARLSTPALVAMIIGLIATILIGLSVVAVWRAYDETKARIQSEALAAAQVVSAHLQWIVGASRQALQQADRVLGEDPLTITAGAKATITEIVGSLPGKVSAWVIDASGRPVFSTAGDNLDVSVADRSYFQALRDGDLTYISPLLIGKTSKNQMFVIARRLERKGVFAGIITIAVPATMMSDFWQKLSLGPSSTVSMFRTDGWLVARYPPADAPMNLSNYVLFTEHLPRSKQGTYDAVSPVDGVSRIVGFTRVDGEPLVALASLGTADMFGQFWRQVFWLGLALAALVGALVYVLSWLVGTLNRENRARAQLAAALERNRLLFQEIHHRVKNNLQAVSSLVRLQPLPAEAKAEMIQRIGAMVAIHEQAYRSDDYEQMSVSDYLVTLAGNLKSAYGKNIAIETDLADVRINREIALPLGLVANEVLSNAMKHAFPDGREGKITVRLKALDNGRAELSIADDGVGFDPNQKKEGKGIGSRLISGLVAQLGGETETVCQNGTVFTLRFARIDTLAA